MEQNFRNRRIEYDTMGEVSVPSDKYWGAQTERSRLNFSIGDEKMPLEVIHALAIIKKAAAHTNNELNTLSEQKRDLIMQAADEIISGLLDDHFLLSVWQTGSGTHTNMNVNEVIANRAIELSGGLMGSKNPVHPNDDVNQAQSSNDVFPSAMHIAAVLEAQKKLLPAIEDLIKTLKTQSETWSPIIKTGRTHLMDATPLSLGQQFSGYTSMMQSSMKRLTYAIEELYPLAIGGTAVGTGINAHPEFASRCVQKIAEYTEVPFLPADNKFEALSSHNALLTVSGALKTLATDLNKIANDIRLMASGPRTGLSELNLPANEPGSSIMPGKVNPTQIEALTMVCAQVIGNDVTVTFAASSGQFELNAYKPVIIYNLLQSIRLLSDSVNRFNEKALRGIVPNEEKIKEYLENTLATVTALNPVIGYENAAKAAKLAYEKHITLKEAVLKLKLMDADEFDKNMQPRKMIHPSE